MKWRGIFRTHSHFRPEFSIWKNQQHPRITLMPNMLSVTIRRGTLQIGSWEHRENKRENSHGLKRYGNVHSFRIIFKSSVSPFTLLDRSAPCGTLNNISFFPISYATFHYTFSYVWSCVCRLVDTYSTKIIMYVFVGICRKISGDRIHYHLPIRIMLWICRKWWWWKCRSDT